MYVSNAQLVSDVVNHYIQQVLSIFRRIISTTKQYIVNNLQQVSTPCPKISDSPSFKRA